jgi:ferritin-like metal-binding protein YciE
MAVGGKGFVLFARAQPDTPGKLLSHAYAYEHLELAAYELLACVADRVADARSAEMARRIAGQERRMAERLAGCMDDAVAASLAGMAEGKIRSKLASYLTDAHAIEAQSIALLERAPRITHEPHLSAIYAGHLDESRAHRRTIDARLATHGASRSAIKDAAMRLGGLSWGAFFHAHPDTPGKLAAFAFAFEHLEIGGYEQLMRVADRAGDRETVAACVHILAQERGAARAIAEQFDRAAEAARAGV